MQKLLTSLLLAVITAASYAQAAYVFPSPTAADEPLTLFIDVNQTNGGLKTILTNHPEMQDSVYIWTWEPSDPVGGNGVWNSSDESKRLTHEGNLLYSLTFIPTDFYGVDAATFFTDGISCLAKLKDGNAFPDDGVGEAKTEDLHVDIIPRLCDDIFCVFPQLSKPDDYLTITYDNNQETVPELQDMGPDDAYLFIRAHYTNASGVNYVAPDMVTSTDVLRMKPVPGQDGFFRLTFIPEDLFEGLIPEGEEIIFLRYFILRPGFMYPGQLPFETYNFSDCVD